MMRQETGGYLQNSKSTHTKLKEIDLLAIAHLVTEIQAMIYDAARVSRLCSKFQVNTSKNKKINSFWGSFFWGGSVWGRGIGLWSISNLD